MTNYYQILGIDRNTSITEIKRAYKKLAVKFHPDKNDGDKYFEERFKEIQGAYEVLSNPKRKADYDRIYDSIYTATESNKYKQPRSGHSSTNNDNNNRQKEKQKRETEEAEKRRVSKIKKNAELAFEDKAWIFVANLMIIGSVIGLFAIVKYWMEGYNKKICSSLWYLNNRDYSGINHHINFCYWK